MISQTQAPLTVKVPGSSANLGPGFDVLSMAVTSYVWASTTASEEYILCDENHIAMKAFRAAGGTGDLWFRHRLPSGRGLGFSAAARTAGAIIAFLQQSFSLNEAKEKSFPLVSELEGHGDNAAASIFGGVMITSGKTYHQIQPTALLEKVTVWVPTSKSETSKSRATLATHPPLQDAVANIGAVSLLLAALYENNADLFAKAMGDQLHEQQRLTVLPSSLEAYQKAQDCGAIATWLSGSGPSIAYIADNQTAPKIEAALQETGRVMHLERSDGVSLC